MSLFPARSLTTSLRAALLALLLVAALVVVQPPGSAADPRDAGGQGAPGGRQDGDPTRTVTLLTGDVVAWHRTAAGEQSAWIVTPATPAGNQPPPQIYEQDGQVHVVPAEAAPYLAAGRLDPNLFNITLLIDQGLDDLSRPTLPLLVEAEGGATARRAPATPTGAREVRTLSSINTSSVLATKQDMRDVWESLRGETIAPYDTKTAQLAGAGKVWLNVRVQTTLADSVPQVGAPEAWAGGFDGEGAVVAVLDSGWDPHHRDLEGVVSEARNFTAEADPVGETAVDQLGHGTHIAATIAGSGAASGGARKGVAPKAELMVGKVIDKSGSGWSDEIIEGMEWAATSGAAVINMSLGTTYASDGTDPMSQAVNVLTKETGTLFVVAAGNAGPGSGTVGSPGAADLALTVGAVDKQDQAADFSSRGPRIGDGAIKPEVVAPGVDIVAARAAGTSLGNLVDEDYTSLNGTSMAAPHVAGAAAILAQQHPDWEADRLKGRLATTSKTLDEPVTFQGAGRIDVAAAVGTSVTAGDAVLDLGAVPQDSDEVTRTLTYTNPTERPVVLRLKSKINGTGVDQKQTAEITFDDTVLRVPAGGTASTSVTLDPRQTAAGGYAGQIIAQVAGQQDAAIHTATSVVVNGPLRTLTFKGIGRDGKPASGPVDVWSAETGAYERVWFEDGAATAQVQDGLYSVMAVIGTESPGGFQPVEEAFAGDPELQVDGDVTLSFDAREAQQIKINTPRPADMSGYHAYWSRTVGERSFKTKLSGGQAGQSAFVIPSKPAQTGSFTFLTEWQLAQPLLTARISGADGAPVSPNPTFASLGDPYVGAKTLPLVDAGQGMADDYAELDVTGKIALVTRGNELEAQTKAAKQAGAALLLVANDAADIWNGTVWRQGMPTYLLTRDAGDALRKALAGDPDLTLDVKGIADAEYNYVLAFPDQDRLPSDVTYDLDHDDLAIVESDYRANSDRMSQQEGWVPVIDSIGQGNILNIRRNGPVQRTEYVSAEGVQWERMAQPHGEFPGFYWTWTPARQYEAGTTSEQLFWGPLVHPAVVDGYGATDAGSPVARFHDAIRVTMPSYSYGDGLWSTVYEQMRDSAELTLRSGGEVLGKGRTSGQFTVPPEQADYELELDVTNGSGNWADTSTHTNSVWTFSSVRTKEERSVLPLVQLGYDLETDAFNDVEAGAAVPLLIGTGYQPGARGPGEFTVTAEVSYDDGETWADAPVDPADGDQQATIPPAPEQAEYASLRVVATDADGNSLTQQIDRAWGISRT